MVLYVASNVPICLSNLKADQKITRVDESDAVRMASASVNGSKPIADPMRWLEHTVSASRISQEKEPVWVYQGW